MGWELIALPAKAEAQGSLVAILHKRVPHLRLGAAAPKYRAHA